MPQDSPEPKTCRIRGTKITSPYPVQLTPAETRLAHSLEQLFPAENIFVDLFFPKPDFADPSSSQAYGSRFAKCSTLPDVSLTQIDCLALSEQGIFVFESKDFNGWIYGRGTDRYWTETINFGQEKHQFYNPVKQNQLHIAALQCSLASYQKLHSKITNPPVISVIVFGSRTTLKSITNLPENCHICTQPTLRTLLGRLLQAQSSSINKTQLSELRSIVNQSRVIPTLSTRQVHISETPRSPN